MPFAGLQRAFSRTPRGFEAPIKADAHIEDKLSAEPLVGLKHSY